MYDIITFGSITWDIFLESPRKGWQVLRSKKFISMKGTCFNLGSKFDVGGISFASGGGGTNTATSFNNQGFKTAFFGGVGNDIAGNEVIERLCKSGVDCSLIIKKPESTNHSIILNMGSDKDRTILVYRGASETIVKKDVPWNKLDAKWFYLAPLSGKLAEITKDIVNFAKVNDIKVAFNPGNSQLELDNIEDIIEKVDVLILNQEEASNLTKIPFTKEAMIFKEIDQMCPGIAIMTKGPDGVVVSDGTYLYKAKSSKIKVVDRTGAGDSFGSGFISGLIRYNNIEEAIQLGIANANSCLQKTGAKNGLLKKGDKYKKIKVEKIKL